MFEVRETPDKGKGLFALRDFSKGEIMATFTAGDDCFCMLVGDFRYSNHSSEHPNCFWNYDGMMITFFAERDIKVGDEIAYDYDCPLWFTPVQE